VPKPHRAFRRGLAVSAPLWRVSLTTCANAEPVLAEVLSSVLGQPASSFTPSDTRRATVSVYSSAKPDWPRARAAIQAQVARLGPQGASLELGPLRLSRLRRQDWAEAWKRHFKPLDFGDRLLVKPSWSKRRARPGQAVVVLDPGLSFGTGQHPTTRFCLEQLVAWRQAGRPQALLDLGAGSGILAIAAARLGYCPVEAVERDPEALHAARANARRNRVAARILFRNQDLARMPLRTARRYDVICANLTADLLLGHRERLVRRLAPRGLLVLAGILRNEFECVRRAYGAGVLRLAASRAEGEWRSAAFTV
jgi:ribosomal protein L11 methyltransferase